MTYQRVTRAEQALSNESLAQMSRALKTAIAQASMTARREGIEQGVQAAVEQLLQQNSTYLTALTAFVRRRLENAVRVRGRRATERAQR